MQMLLEHVAVEYCLCSDGVQVQICLPYLILAVECLWVAWVIPGTLT
jgi:hypothetical protein